MSVRVNTKTFKAILDHIIVAEMNFGEQVSKGGIVIKSDDGKTEGVKPRWAKVWAIGPDQKDVKVDEWVLVEHARWTRGIEIETETGETITIRRIDSNAILAAADRCPEDVSLGALTTPKEATFDFSDTRI